MSDQQQTKGALARVFGKDKPRAAPTDEEIHEEAIVRALTDTRRLREDLKGWQERAQYAERILEEETQKFKDELRDIRAKMESTIVKLQQENDMLRDNLNKSTAEGEANLRWATELVTKGNDIEMYFMAELNRIADAANQSANTMISMINGSGASMKKFMDDLNKKRGTNQYAPKPGPKKEEVKSAVDHKQLATELQLPEYEKPDPIPEFLTQPKSEPSKPE